MGFMNTSSQGQAGTPPPMPSQPIGLDSLIYRKPDLPIPEDVRMDASGRDAFDALPARQSKRAKSYGRRQ